MKCLNNTIQAELDVKSMIKLSDLIFYDGPLLSHYETMQQQQYLFYWVDSDDEANRWLAIHTDNVHISDYLSKAITLNKLIKDAINKVCFVVDIDSDGNVHDLQLCAISDLPDDYLPEEDSFYNFHKKDADIPSQMSRRLNAGILELHIEGDKVDYGSAPLDIVSHILPTIETMRSKMAPQYLKRVLGRRNQNDFRTELVFKYAMAGSLRLGLQYETQGNDNAVAFFNEMIDVLDCGIDDRRIQNIANIYEKDVLFSYEKLATFLCDNNLDMRVTSSSPQGIRQSNVMSRCNNPKIVERLQSLIQKHVELFDVLGHFEELNVRTGKYKFIVNDSKKSSVGRLSNALVLQAATISFAREYHVSIRRTTDSQPGRADKVYDEIVVLNSSEN